MAAGLTEAAVAAQPRLPALSIMENEKSRIPVYSFQHPKITDVPKDAHHSKKQCVNKAVESEPLTDPDFSFGTHVPANVVFKGKNQRVMKPTKNVAAAAAPPLLPKKGVAASGRNPVSKYRREAELRNWNKQLETVKCELSLKLAEMQSYVNNVKEQNEVLEEENQQLKKFKETCMLVLETRNCDLGSANLEEEEETKKRQSKIMALTEELNADLEMFSQLAKEQKDNLQNTKLKWKQVGEEHVHFLEQQQSFRTEMEELSAILDQEEALLNT